MERDAKDICTDYQGIISKQEARIKQLEEERTHDNSSWTDQQIIVSKSKIRAFRQEIETLEGDEAQ